MAAAVAKCGFHQPHEKSVITAKVNQLLNVAREEKVSETVVCNRKGDVWSHLRDAAQTSKRQPHIII